MRLALVAAQKTSSTYGFVWQFPLFHYVDLDYHATEVDGVRVSTDFSLDARRVLVFKSTGDGGRLGQLTPGV